MEDQEVQDTIVIELGTTLSDDKYEEVLHSVMEFMNYRWPDFAPNRFTT